MNLHFLNLLRVLLTSLGISSMITKASPVTQDDFNLEDTESETSSNGSSPMVGLVVEGISNVFTILLPMMTKYAHIWIGNFHSIGMVSGGRVRTS